MAGFSKEQNAAIKLLVKEVFQSEHDNEMVKGLLKDTLEGGLLKNTLEEGLLKEVLQDDFEIRKTPRFKAANGGVQITDLPSVNQFGSGDLMLVRKTAQGQDSSIVYDNFLNSIGNTAIGGFVATVDPQNANGIILNPVNGVGIPAYVNNMKVSFVSPIASDGQVQVKIGTLTYNNLYAYNSTTTSVLKIGDYVEAVLINGSPNNAFYQTNNAQYVYTNDYVVYNYSIATGGVATTLYLKSAYGVSKTSYYIGMTINFTCPINTEGFVRLSIDGLPMIDLIEYIDSGIPLELFTNQAIQATYNGESFVPNAFRIQDPTITPINITQDPTDEEIENVEMPPLIIPPQNSLEYSVDNSGINSFSTLKECIEKILSNFPNGAESGVKVTITINKTLDASSTLFTVDRDLSWITLRSNNQNININKNGTKGYIFTQTSGRFFNFEKDTILTITNAESTEAAIFLNISSGNIILNDLTITGDNLIYCFSLSPAVKMELTNCHLKNMRQAIYSVGASINLTGCTLKNWILYALLVVPSANVIVNLNNCDLRKNQNSSIDDIVTITNTFYTKLTVNQINTKAKFGQNGQEIQPNSATSLLAYNVSGGQN